MVICPRLKTSRIVCIVSSWPAWRYSSESCQHSLLCSNLPPSHLLRSPLLTHLLSSFLPSSQPGTPMSFQLPWWTEELGEPVLYLHRSYLVWVILHFLKNYYLRTARGILLKCLGNFFLSYLLKEFVHRPYVRSHRNFQPVLQAVKERNRTPQTTGSRSANLF